MKRIAFLLFTVSLLPAAARAQPGPGPGGRTAEFAPATAVDRRTMYEDIEIMRRLLSRTLVSRPASLAQCTQCHGANVQFHNVLVTETNPGFKDLTGSAGIVADFDSDGKPDLFVVNSIHSHTGPAPFAIEGAYLRTYGIVYNLTLPPQAREELAPAGPTQPAKRATEWDQVRGEVRGDKAAPPSPAKKATLVDALLQVIAENGKYFSQLPANENLTLILTFRGGHPVDANPRTGGKGGMMGSMMGSTGMGAPGKPTFGSSTGAGPGGMMGPNNGAGPPGGYFPIDEPQTPDRELELLAELHLKQGKLAEAASAYERALAKASDIRIDKDQPFAKVKEATDRANARIEELMRKLAEVRLKSGDLDGARRALDGKSVKIAIGQTKNTAPQPAPAAMKVPGKLILTVSKRVLDQVGNGTMTFAEFQKQVSLEVADLDSPGRQQK